MLEIIQGATETESGWTRRTREFRESAWEALHEHRLAYAFLIPVLLYMTLFVWLPGIQGIIMSLFNWPLFGTKEFVGVQNYRQLLSMDIFYTSLKATLLYGTQTVPQLILGTTMALIVWSLNNRRITTLVSAIFVFPYVIPPLISGGIFRLLFHPNVGPFFKYLVNQGILQQPIYWMSNGGPALAFITAVGVWTWTPLVFLLVSASLEGIPSSYYEVASVYGANRWEKFRYITFPQIKSTLLLALILRIIWNLGKVSQPLQITRGGPGFKTSVLGILLYRFAWNRRQFGMAFTIGVVLAVITIIIILLFIREYERGEGEIRA